LKKFININENDLQEYQQRNKNDFGLKKFKNQRVKSITYVKNPAGNLGLYLKNTRMNKVASINDKMKRSNTMENLKSN